MTKSREMRQNYHSFKMILDIGLSEKVIHYAKGNEMKITDIVHSVLDRVIFS